MVSFFLIKVIIIAKKAPTPAASMGVNTPPQIPPKTAPANSIAGQAFAKLNNFSRSVDFGPRGPISALGIMYIHQIGGCRALGY
jgi:hypothetical protein